MSGQDESPVQTQLLMKAAVRNTYLGYLERWQGYIAKCDTMVLSDTSRSHDSSSADER